MIQTISLGRVNFKVFSFRVRLYATFEIESLKIEKIVGKLDYSQLASFPSLLKACSMNKHREHHPDEAEKMQIATERHGI